MKQAPRIPDLTPKEKIVEKYLRDEVKKLGGRAYKFVSPAHRSVPDRIILMPKGRIYFVEVKRSGGKLTQNQMRELETIEQLGFRTFVAYGKEGVDQFIKHVRYKRI